MRADEDAQKFVDFLRSIGSGQYPVVESNGKSDLIDLPESLICSKDIVEEIYGDILTKKTSDLANIAILALKNDHCAVINRKVLNLLPGEERVYSSINTLITENENELLQFPTEFLDGLDVSALPQHKLCLKEGTIVILLRNLNPKKGLLNGICLIVRKMYDNSVLLEIITGIKIGQKVLLPRIDLTSSDTAFLFYFKRGKFPIRLAFCMTINKAQGQTLDRVGIYLPEPVFSYGQLYVILSRGKSFKNVNFQILPNDCRTANVVWKEVLS